MGGREEGRGSIKDPYCPNLSGNITLFLFLKIAL